MTCWISCASPRTVGKSSWTSISICTSWLCRRCSTRSRAPSIAFASVLSICSQKGKVGSALRAMDRVDFLGRYMPEFGQLTCLVQHEFFHRYTTDEHTLVCIEKLDRLLETDNPKLVNYRELLLKLKDPLVLYLALLLHDTGKAANVRSHAEASALFAQKVARRLQLTPEQRRGLERAFGASICRLLTIQKGSASVPWHLQPRTSDQRQRDRKSRNPLQDHYSSLSVTNAVEI